MAGNFPYILECELRDSAALSAQMKKRGFDKEVIKRDWYKYLSIYPVPKGPDKKSFNSVVSLSVDFWVEHRDELLKLFDFQIPSNHQILYSEASYILEKKIDYEMYVRCRNLHIKGIRERMARNQGKGHRRRRCKACGQFVSIHSLSEKTHGASSGV